MWHLTQSASCSPHPQRNNPCSHPDKAQQPSAHTISGVGQGLGPECSRTQPARGTIAVPFLFLLQELGGEDWMFSSRKAVVHSPPCQGAASYHPPLSSAVLYVCPVGHGHDDQVNYICVIK